MTRLLKKTTEIGLLVLGFGLAFFGGFMGYFWQQILDASLYKELRLEPGSSSFEAWQLTQVPIYMKVYFWNWTNPVNLTQPGYKPIFVQLGPYTFREQHEKTNITWNTNGTVTFQIIKRWWFEPSLTNGSLSDNVTSVNAVAGASAYMARKWGFFQIFSLSSMLSLTKQELHWTHNVSQLLFEGFENKLQTIGSSLPGVSHGYDRFGWFYKKNDTVSPFVYNIDTGVSDITQLGQLKNWNYKNTNDYFDSNCSKISGSMGEFWSPHLHKDDVLTMYSADMCRQQKFFFNKETEYEELKVFKYSGTNLTFDNGTADAGNQCYCEEDECQPSGVTNLSKCRHGAPIFISFPHFYAADEYYVNRVQGMEPDGEEHGFHMYVEPKTGLQLYVTARYQINFLLQENSKLTMYKNLPKLFIPVFWTETEVRLPEDKIDDILLLHKLPVIGRSIFITVWLIGTVLVVVVLVIYCRHKSRKKKSNAAEPITTAPPSDVDSVFLAMKKIDREADSSATLLSS